jgi:hypothetical protein
MAVINLMNVEEVVGDALIAIDQAAVCDEQSEAFAEEMMDIVYSGGTEEEVQAYVEAIAREVRAEDFCYGDEPVSVA